MFACVNVLHLHTQTPQRYISLFPSLPPARVRAPERHQSLFRALQLCISICWPQMSRRATLRPRSWRAPRGKGGSKGGDRRAWGHRLGMGYRHGARPCQRRVTLSYRDTQARAATAVGDVAASGGDAGRTLSLPHCLLVVRRTGRQDGAHLPGFTTNFK